MIHLKSDGEEIMRRTWSLNRVFVGDNSTQYSREILPERCEGMEVIAIDR
jgi:hypothetical protein